MAQVCLGMNVRSYLKNNYSKRDWRSGSSGRVPASQVQFSEFNPQYLQKRKKEKKFVIRR
jgi:hypothetical protein